MPPQLAHKTKACPQSLPWPGIVRGPHRARLLTGGPHRMRVSGPSRRGGSSVCWKSVHIAVRSADAGTKSAGAPGASSRSRSWSQRQAKRSRPKASPSLRRSATSLASRRPLEARREVGRSLDASPPLSSAGWSPGGRRRRCCSRCQRGCASSMTSSAPSESVFKKRTKAANTASLNLDSSTKESLAVLANCGACRWVGSVSLFARGRGLSSELLESELKIATGCGCPGGSWRGNGRAVVPAFPRLGRGNGSASEPLESELKIGRGFGGGFGKGIFLISLMSCTGLIAAGTGCKAFPAASSASLVWPGPWRGAGGGWARDLAPRSARLRARGCWRCIATMPMRPSASLSVQSSSSSSSCSSSKESNRPRSSWRRKTCAEKVLQTGESVPSGRASRARTAAQLRYTRASSPGRESRSDTM
mmetsp:Transcript_93084/g.277905  ORF Transcript_93084/g.277905 Transcript_93084/m.277905 type:complete len:419 (+) Transcript_93084:170-1426(+)